MANIDLQNVSGDLQVSRNLAAGGSLSVTGKTELGGRVVVKDWLDAPNIVGPGKGIFAKYDDLYARYPRPLGGWWAITDLEVEDGVFKGLVYIGRKGQWEAFAEGEAVEIKIEVPDITASDKINGIEEDIASLEGRVGELETDLPQEETAREEADDALEGKISDETKAREDEDAALAARLLALQTEANGIGEAVTEISQSLETAESDIAAETKAREEADTALENKISAKQDKLEYYEEDRGDASIMVGSSEVLVTDGEVAVNTGKFYYNGDEVLTRGDVCDDLGKAGETDVLGVAVGLELEEEITASSPARFDGIYEQGDTRLVQGKLDGTPDAVYWLCDRKIFVAVKAEAELGCDGETVSKTYYTDWDGSEAYMVSAGESGGLRQDKIYIHGGSLYVWKRCDGELVKAGGVADSVLSDEDIDEIMEGFEFVETGTFLTGVSAEGAGLMEMGASVADGVADIKGHTTIGCVGYDDVVDMFENVEV